MNILEIIVIVVSLLLAVSGFRKGFVKKLAAMVSLVLSVALVSALLPYITQFLKDSTPVYSFLVSQCENVMEEQAAKSLLSDSGIKGSGSGAADDYGSMGRDQIKALLEQNGYDSSMVDILSDEQLEEYKKQYIQQYMDQYLGGEGQSANGGEQSSGIGGLTRIEQTELIEGLPLPETLRDILLDYNNEEGYQSLHVSNFGDYIVSFVATSILNVVAFIVSVIVVQLLLWVVFRVLNVLANFPLISIVNRFAGLLLGLLQALFLVWIFFLILSMLSATEIGLQLMAMVERSELLSWLYESNVFVQIVLRAAAIFA